MLTVLSTAANLVSTVAFVLTALYVRAELKALEKDRYLTVTHGLFTIWQSQDFMEAQLWLLHRLEETEWEAFISNHRGDYGERAFHRVGSFYDRIGTLVRRGIVDRDEILATVSGYAIATWLKIEPLVREARRVENSVLFENFEHLLPSCYECYVPSLGLNPDVRPFTLPPDGKRRDRPGRPSDRMIPHIRRDRAPGKMRPAELKRRMERGTPTTVIDVRRPDQVEADPRSLPEALMIPLTALTDRAAEVPLGRPVVTLCA